MREIFTSGSVGRAQDNRCLYPEADVIDAFLKESWKVGEPVEVQWIVTPDGKTFSLSHMGSAAWQGVTFDNILVAIYK